MSNPQFFMIDSTQLDVLRALARRLHTEDRMDGNMMRDAGHALDAIVRVVEQLVVIEAIKVRPGES